MTTDAGLAVLQGLFKDLQIDEEWSEFGDRSFVWWPHRVAQRVIAGPTYVEDGDTLSWVSVETDLFRASAEEWADVEADLEEFALYASLSGMLWRDGMVLLRAAAPVYAEMTTYLRRLLALAAVEQLDLAERWTRSFGEVLEVATSGSRVVPDEMIAAALSLPHRDEPSLWGQGFLDGFGQKLWDMSDGAIVATGDIGGYAVEVPVGPNGGPSLVGGISDLIEVGTRDIHPTLGAGLSLRLKLHEEPETDGRTLRPLEFNAIEARAAADAAAGGARYYAYQFGSWCVDPVARTLTHASFFPNVLAADAGALFTLVINEINRSEWVSRTLLGLDREVAYERSRERTAEVVRRKEAGTSIDDLLAPPLDEETIRDIEARRWPY